MSRATAGYEVETPSGVGRTYHNKPNINGKIQVFLATKFVENKKYGIKTAVEYSQTAILCDPEKVKLTGFID